MDVKKAENELVLTTFWEKKNLLKAEFFFNVAFKRNVWAKSFTLSVLQDETNQNDEKQQHSCEFESARGMFTVLMIPYGFSLLHFMNKSSI